MAARSNGEGLEASKTLGRGKATERKDGEGKGTTGLNVSFQFPRYSCNSPHLFLSDFQTSSYKASSGSWASS